MKRMKQHSFTHLITRKTEVVSREAALTTDQIPSYIL
jgi:hypothetical protein